MVRLLQWPGRYPEQSSQADPCTSSHLDWLRVPPHHGLPITVPKEMHFLPCPLPWDAELHFKPAGPPSEREHSHVTALKTAPPSKGCFITVWLKLLGISTGKLLRACKSTGDSSSRACLLLTTTAQGKGITLRALDTQVCSV